MAAVSKRPLAVRNLPPTAPQNSAGPMPFFQRPQLMRSPAKLQRAVIVSGSGHIAASKRQGASGRPIGSRKWATQELAV